MPSRRKKTVLLLGREMKNEFLLTSKGRKKFSLIVTTPGPREKLPPPFIRESDFFFSQGGGMPVALLSLMGGWGEALY